MTGPLVPPKTEILPLLKGYPQKETRSCWECGGPCTLETTCSRGPRDFCSAACAEAYTRRLAPGSTTGTARISRWVPRLLLLGLLGLHSSTPPDLAKPPSILYIPGSPIDPTALIAERRQETMSMLVTLRELGAEHPYILYTGALLLNQEGRAREALHLLHTALQENPRLTDALNLLAEIYLQHGEALLAVAALRESLLLYPGQLTAGLHLYEVLRELGLSEEAGRIRTELRTRWPDEVPAEGDERPLDSLLPDLAGLAAEYRRRAEELRTLVSYREAPRPGTGGSVFAFIKSAGRLLETEPCFADLHAELAHHLHDQGRLDEALRHLLLAHHLGDRSGETAFNLCVGFFEKHHLRLAGVFLALARERAYAIPEAFATRYRERVEQALTGKP